MERKNDSSGIMRFSIVDTNSVRIPEYAENANSRTYVSWGVDNMFPNFINELYKGSATLRAIIDGTTNYICGNGLSISDDAAKWREEVNRRGETLEDLIEQMGLDLMKFNGFAVQVIYSRLGEIKELYALDFGRVRVSGDYKKVYYAKSWGKYSAKYDVYDAFDRSNIDPNNPTQIFYYKGSARTYYPTSTWEGSFRDCLAEISASKYVLNNMANGLAAKTIITLPNTSGLLTDDDKKKVEESIKTKFTGPDADSSFFLYWKQEEGEDLKVDSIQVQDESDKFDKIRTAARENIFVSLNATPALFGLPNKNNGFTEQEYKESFNLYQKTQVGPRQKKIQRALDRILGTKDGVTILPFNIETKDEEE